MKELFQIRLGLETLAARLAAEAMADPVTKARFEREIEAIWDEHPRPPGAEYIDENHQFHDAVVAASGNEQLLKLTRQLRRSPSAWAALRWRVLSEEIGVWIVIRLCRSSLGLK
jgi:DNA-binding GntR family transcriptional regulator